MREFSLFIDGDALGREEFMPINGLVNAGSAQEIEAVQLDVGGKDVHGMVTVSVTGWLARGQENCWAGRMSVFDPQDW